MEGSIILRRRRRTTAKSPWTQERVEYSTARWSEGASARQISRELGHGISRSAVLGLIYRLGIADLSPFGGRRGRRSNKKAAGAKKAGAKKTTRAKGARARKRSPALRPVWTYRRPRRPGSATPILTSTTRASMPPFPTRSAARCSS